MQNKVLIVDFGSQYTQLIARRIRELFIYCEISPFNNIPDDLNQYKAIVLSGSPFSVNQENSPKISDAEYDQLFFTLKNLEEKFPQYLTEDSPTQNVGSHILDKFEKHEHRTPIDRKSTRLNSSHSSVSRMPSSA